MAQLSWQIGKVKITRIAEMTPTVPYHEKYSILPHATPEAIANIDWLRPHFANDQGDLLMSIHALLVEAPGIRMVVDTCIGNDKPRKMTGGNALQTSFLEKMTSAGWSRESVNTVVCTHLHVDHVGWNTMLVNNQWQPTFANADYLIGREEYEYWSQSQSEDQIPVMADSVTPIFSAGLAKLVEMDHKISEEISLKPTPGHTPGHISVAITSEGKRALITGDFMHHPCQIAQPDWYARFDEDAHAAIAMRKQQLAELVDQDVLVIGTHFAAPTAGHIVRDNNSYYFKC